MKFILVACFSLLLLNYARAQSNSFGLIKFKIPGGWQEQTRREVLTYSGTDAETNTPLEIKVYQNEVAGVKADSSFRTQWQTVMGAYGNPPVPYAKKRYASSGLQVAINQANPVEIVENEQKKSTQLVVFIIDKQMQAVQFITNSAGDFKLLRPFIDDFIETVDTIAKRD